MKILIATDGSEDSMAAVEERCRMIIRPLGRILFAVFSVLIVRMKLIDLVRNTGAICFICGNFVGILMVSKTASDWRN